MLLSFFVFQEQSASNISFDFAMSKDQMTEKFSLINLRVPTLLCQGESFPFVQMLSSLQFQCSSYMHSHQTFISLHSFCSYRQTGVYNYSKVLYFNSSPPLFKAAKSIIIPFGSSDGYLSHAELL